MLRVGPAGGPGRRPRCAGHRSRRRRGRTGNRQAMAAGSTVQGPWGVKAPMARSGRPTRRRVGSTFGSADLDRCVDVGSPWQARDPGHGRLSYGPRSSMGTRPVGGSAPSAAALRPSLVADRMASRRSGRRDDQAAVVATEPEGVGQDRRRAPTGGRRRPRCRGGCRGRAARSRRWAGCRPCSMLRTHGHRLDGAAGARARDR